MKKRFDIGYRFRSADIRREQLIREIDEGITIMYLSDFHFNMYGYELSRFIIKTVESEHPDIVLFGGDYVDSKYGLKYLEAVFERIGEISNAYAIAGNHDSFLGVERLKNLARIHNITWIESSLDIQLKGYSICISSIPEKKEKVDIDILLLHEPLNPGAVSDIYDLVFAGHLHGCQFNLWENKGYSYPGAIFYKNNFKKMDIGNNLYLISNGLGDTLPLRYNCPKDVIIVSIY